MGIELTFCTKNGMTLDRMTFAALVPHDLCDAGMAAIGKDGSRWVFNPKRNHWACVQEGRA